jgi:hypothetical protein
MSNTLLQPAAFLTLLYAGILAGIAYDALRILRRLFVRGFVQVLCDILFALITILLLTGALLLAAGGVMRIYLLCGMALGFWLQQFSISHLFFRLFYALRARL